MHATAPSALAESTLKPAAALAEMAAAAKGSGDQEPFD